jgi:hypothetical protein
MPFVQLVMLDIIRMSGTPESGAALGTFDLLICIAFVSPLK